MVRYEYDALGNLRKVTLADGRVIEYVVDGLGRRIGKKVDGVLVKGWLYKDGLDPVAKVHGSGRAPRGRLGETGISAGFLFGVGGAGRRASPRRGSGSFPFGGAWRPQRRAPAASARSRAARWRRSKCGRVAMAGRAVPRRA